MGPGFESQRDHRDLSESWGLCRSWPAYSQFPCRIFSTTPRSSGPGNYICAPNDNRCIPMWLGIGPVAQLVEQLTLNQWVRGSSPRGTTKTSAKAGVFVFINRARSLSRATKETREAPAGPQRPRRKPGSLPFGVTFITMVWSERRLPLRHQNAHAPIDHHSPSGDFPRQYNGGASTPEVACAVRAYIGAPGGWSHELDGIPRGTLFPSRATRRPRPSPPRPAFPR